MTVIEEMRSEIAKLRQEKADIHRQAARTMLELRQTAIAALRKQREHLEQGLKEHRAHEVHPRDEKPKLLNKSSMQKRSGMYTFDLDAIPTTVASYSHFRNQIHSGTGSTHWSKRLQTYKNSFRKKTGSVNN